MVYGMKHSLPITILLGAILSLGACGGTPAGNSSSEVSSSVSSVSELTSESPVSTSESSPSEESSSPATTEESSVVSETPSSSEESSESLSSSSSEKSSESSSSSSEQSSSSSASSSSSSSSSPDTDPKWKVNFNQYGKEFMVTLGKLIVASGKVTSYADQKVIGPKAAAYPNEDSKTFIPFYKEPKAENVISASDFNTSTGWNREHTWPNSRGGGYFENDAVMIRPAAVKDNSNRGNKFYGLGGSEWDPADCGYEQARGEAARIILYCATAYNDDVSLSNNPGDASSEHTMGTLKTLLKWNRQYQPSEFEKTVNERLDKYGYRRNPFVDHPEYAEYIWDDNGLRTSKPEGGDIPSSSSQTSVEPAATYNQVMDFSNLDGKQFAVTASDGTHYYNMTSNAKSDKLPWYIIGDSCTYKDGVMSTECDIHWFTFNETAQDAYEITTTDGRYLYGYIAGTHYSIGLAKTDAEIAAQQGGTAPSAISKQWKLEAGQNGTFQLTTAGVYLEYYNGSFCGYKSAPSNPLMLFA